MDTYANWDVLDQISTFVGKLNTDGRLTSVNAHALAAADLAPSDVIGRHFWDCYWWQVDQETRDQLKDAFRRCLDGEHVRYDVTVQIADGQRIVIDFQMVPVRDDQGRVDHIIPSGQDITQRIEMERAMRESTALVDSLFSAAPVGLVVHDSDYRYLKMNQAMADINGLPVEDHIGRHPGELFQGMLDDDLIFTIWDRLKEDGGEPVTMEFAAQTPASNHPCDFRVHYFPVNSDREVHGIGAVVEDVTERKRAERERDTLAREMQHRVKNIISTMQAIARQTAKNADSIEGYDRALRGRLAALGAAHTTLFDDADEGGAIHVEDIVRLQIEPYTDGAGHQLDLDGPGLAITYRLARGLSLALHELATNAAKYGALSDDRGRLRVEWLVKQEEGSDTLVLDWSETCTRPVSAPSDRGFGTRLIDVSIQDNCRGTVSRDWTPQGLKATIACPLGGD